MHGKVNPDPEAVAPSLESKKHCNISVLGLIIRIWQDPYKRGLVQRYLTVAMILCSCSYISALGFSGFLWIGLRDETGNNDDYRWTRDGDSLTFSNWAPTQPNTPAEQCVVTGTFEPGTGLWGDNLCVSQWGAICEADKASQIRYEDFYIFMALLLFTVGSRSIQPP